MDYEKLYREALERAREIHSHLHGENKENYEKVFPELKKSEDERIRKAIHIYLDWLDGKKEYAPKGEYSIRDMIAWLEKQGSQNLANSSKTCKDDRTMAQYIDKSTLVAEIEKLIEKYSECPTRNSYEEGLKDGRLIGYKDALYKINSLEVKDVNLNATDEQKQLNEQTYKAFDTIFENYERLYGTKQDTTMKHLSNKEDDVIDWLKSLKNRLQPTWKPTEEQLQTLKDTINHDAKYTRVDVLESLINDLKKL